MQSIDTNTISNILIPHLQILTKKFIQLLKQDDKQ